MIDLAYRPPPPGFKNTSGRFVALGILLLVLAAGSGCLTALIPVGLMVTPAVQSAHSPSAAGQPSTPIVVPLVGSGLYLAATVVLAWCGIGAILKRRWVRPVVLVLGSVWLLFAVVACVEGAVAALLFGLPGGNAVGVPGIGVAIVLTLSGAVLLGLPLTFILLVRPESVRETAEHYDTKTRWTDGVPIPLLGLSLALATTAFFTLAALARPRYPLFGILVRGPAALAIFAMTAAALAYAAYRVYRIDMRGWWVGLIACNVPVVAALPSAFLMPTDRMKEMLADLPQAADFVDGHEALARAGWACVIVITPLLFTLYMLRVRPLLARTSPHATLAGLKPEAAADSSAST